MVSRDGAFIAPRTSAERAGEVKVEIGGLRRILDGHRLQVTERKGMAVDRKPKRGITRQKSSRVKRRTPMPSRDKVRAHRVRMRKQGMRPITIWVPDVRSPKFAAEARRQCRLANASPYARDDQAWVDAMSDWSAD
jgi:hypothetical protein